MSYWDEEKIAPWDKRQRGYFTKLDKFGEKVYKDLKAAIDSKIKGMVNDTCDIMKQESVTMENFVAAHRSHFAGRESILEEMFNFISNEDSGYFVITGDSGYGKTTLMTKFYEDLIDFNKKVKTK